MINLSICLVAFIFLLITSLFIINMGVILIMGEIAYFFEIEIISLNSNIIVITILIDWMSCFFLSFVCLISSLVIFYRIDYMSGDKSINRFILLVLIFVLSIVLLIISPNLIRILLGWDGLGLVSYLLVIYFQNVKSFNAGMLTAISNRVGEVILLLSIAWMLNYGSWNYIFYLEFIGADNDMGLIGVFIVIAAITKSAQIPFSAWLPAAIAAPTPVSALVHSSTLVTAGVYLLIRFRELLDGLFVIKVLLLIGGLTIFIAGLGANFEFDLKKIIALSTLRQLGLIIIILSIKFADLAFFHLLAHALFKALLFMCAGVIIHMANNFQDIRYIGSLIYQIPLTVSFFNAANLALCGFPFLAGFYSKDIILEVSSMGEINLIIYFLYFFSTGLTVCYSLRLMYYTMYSNYHSWANHSIFDGSIIIRIGMTGLFFMSVIGGSLLSWFIFSVPYVIVLPHILKAITLIVCGIGGIIGYYLSQWNLYLKSKIFNFFLVNRFVGSIWFLPFIATSGVVWPPLLLGNNYLKSVDTGWLEIFGGQNLYRKLIQFSHYFSFLQVNSLKIFLMLFLLWVIIFLLIFN